MDFAIQNVLTNGELRLNLTMITDNDKFFQKHYIARTLFIIIQIIGKTKSRKNIPFLEQMRHIRHVSM